MLKPPTANMPGVTDTLEFVKNLWGSMNLPGTNLSGMTAPPMSAEDLDKRIADLKAVESWLNMNLTMLRGTIQTMEVQRATLSSLKAMGASMAEAMRQSGVSAEKMAAMPFGAMFTPAQQPQTQDATAPRPSSADEPAETAMPVAFAWWNLMQEQFQQAVANAASLTEAHPAAAENANAIQPGQQDAQPSPPATGTDDVKGPGPRASRTRTDKN